ncbi:MAG: ABC transporter ATP-binding protein, partial [Clostridia bacterium]|nr:ABC transporter ATP-binding protein [Clostridia bacterium]
RTKGTMAALKRFMPYVGEYKGVSIWTSALVAVEVIFEVFIPLIMAQIINSGMDENATTFTFYLDLGSLHQPIFTMDNRIEFIVVCGVMMIVMAILSLLCGALSGKFAATAATGFGKNVRRSVFYKVQNFSFANLDHFNTASLVTRLTTDVTNIQNSYMMIIRILVRAPFMLILAICMALTISPDLTVIFAVVLPVLLVGMVVGVMIVYPRFEKMLHKYDDMNESTQENLTGIRAVKAYVREENETKRFKEVSAAVQKLQFAAEKIIVLAMPLMQILIYACIICIVWFGGNHIVAGKMAIGDLSAFLSYVMQILMSFMMVAVVFMMVVLSRASMDRIIAVWDEKLDIEDGENAKDIVPEDGSIDVDNVDFSYSDNP